MPATFKRVVKREHSRLPLSEQLADIQVKHGLYTSQRGERLPIPVDDLKHPTRFLNRDLWVQDRNGIHRPGAKFVGVRDGMDSRQKRVLGWLRDHVSERIPYLYYNAVLGHDVHVTQWAKLSAKHWHRGWANPFNPESNDAPLDPTFKHSCVEGDACEIHSVELQMTSHWGFVENLGLLSQGKVTKVFVNVQVGALTDSAGTGEAAEFNDFNEHEVGTDNTSEANTHTALQATSGISLVAGTQVDDGGDPPTYTTVATITADASETWEEHGVFSTTTDTLMDRSLTGGQAVNSSDQVQYTYTATINPEA